MTNMDSKGNRSEEYETRRDDDDAVCPGKKTRERLTATMPRLQRKDGRHQRRDRARRGRRRAGRMRVENRALGTR